MPFNKFGYLGTEIIDFVEENHKKHKDLFSLLYRINSYFHETKFKYVVRSGNLQQQYGMALLIKVMDSAQAATVLILRGLDSDSQSILRVASETFIILKAVCEKPEFIYKYLDTEKVYAKKYMDIIKNDGKSVFDKEIKNNINKEEYEWLVKEIKDKNLNKLNAEQLAKECGLEVLYDIVYRLLSNEVHTSVNSLDKYFKMEDDLLTIDCLPKSENISQILFTIITIMLYAINSTNEMFEVDKEKTEVGKFGYEYIGLINKYQEVNLFDKLHL